MGRRWRRLCCIYIKCPQAERQKLGENGRRYFKEHFDQDVLTDQLIDHFRVVSESFKGDV